MFDNVNEKRIGEFGNFIKNNVVDKASIIEIGCDTGKLSFMLQNNYDLFLIDLEDNRQYCKDLNFKVLDATKDKLPFDDNSVDCIVATQVIEHLEDITYFFNELYRVLKPNGKVIISYPNYSNIFQRMMLLKNGMPVRLGCKINSGGHINFMPFKFLLDWLSPKFKINSSSGDYFASVSIIPKICSIFNKDLKDKHFIIPNKSLLFSYNVNAVFTKIEK